MGRWARCHLANGIYYLRLSASRDCQLFYDGEDIAQFEGGVCRALTVCDAFVHAYAWAFDSARLVVQIGDIPAGDLVQRIASAHSRRIHRRHHVGGCLFERHRAVLIRSERYVLKAVRYVHCVALYEGRCADPASDPHTSHRAYLGLVEASWLTTQYVHQLLAARVGRATPSYREFMQRHTPHDGAALECGPPWVPHEAGPDLTNGEPGTSRTKRSEGDNGAALETIIASVSGTLKVSRADIFSTSRCPRIARARALITWRATTTGIATLRGVARHLERDPSSLSTTLLRYRQREPALFGGERR